MNMPRNIITKLAELMDKKAQSYLKTLNGPVIMNTIAKVKQRNPNWDDNFLLNSISTIGIYAPSVLLDPNLTYQVVRRIDMYGGVEPTLIKELQDIEHSMKSIQTPNR